MMIDSKTLAQERFCFKFLSIKYGLIFSVLLAPLCAIGVAYFQRPLQRALDIQLFQGIHYSRRFRSSPRPMMIHLVTLELSTPGLQPFVTPSFSNDPEQRQSIAQTTSTFLRKFGLQLAINGSFFYHFREKSPWEYYPHSGDRVWVMGTAISNQKPYLKTLPGFPTVCFTDRQTAAIVDNGQCPTNTLQALSGNEIFVRQRKLIQTPSERARDWHNPYPRTAIALDASGRKVWLIVVDGKQPLYSEGATMPELANLAIEMGATTALNLDGGGSVTLVMDNHNAPQVLNSPIQAKIPTWERPIANHLGFYAKPLRNQ